MCQEYNGYSNYFTWAVNLWWDNEEASQQHIMELAETAYDNAVANTFSTRDQVARYDLAKTFKDMVHNDNPIDPDEATVYSDLMSAAINWINWYELAETWITSVKEAREYAAQTA